MYMPFMRSKQNEQLAFAELAHVCAAKSNVIPIFEPVRDLDVMLNRFQNYNVTTPMVLIVNPDKGDYEYDNAGLNTRIQAVINAVNPIMPALIVRPTVTLQNITDYQNAYPSHRHVYIHFDEPNSNLVQNAILSDSQNCIHVLHSTRVSPQYHQLFSAHDRVLLTDPFNKQLKNADYPDDERYPNNFENFSGNNYFGVSDFLTQGDVFSQRGGGAALTVAIHLTYETRGILRVKHVKSDLGVRGEPLRRIYLQALSRADSEIQRLQLRTIGAQEILDEFASTSSNQSRSGSLGLLKKYSFKHHIELMSTLV